MAFLPVVPVAARRTARRTARTTFAAALTTAVLASGAVVAGALVTSACRGPRDSASAARESERQEIRRAAEQAAQMASGDTGRRSAQHAAPAAGRDSGARLHIGSDGASSLTRAADPPLGAGDVRVASTDGAVVLALIGDTVRMRLGDSVAAKVRREVGPTDTVSGFGGFVSSTVKAAVGGAMGEMMRFAVRVPVTEVRDLRYENGELRFSTREDRRGGDARARRRDQKGVNSSAHFAPADAERFISAVRARQRALGVTH
jgi:hypothetical protein